jgi:hypothetical protein
MPITEARRALLERPSDIIITDQTMPGLNVTDFCMKLSPLLARDAEQSKETAPPGARPDARRGASREGQMKQKLIMLLALSSLAAFAAYAQVSPAARPAPRTQLDAATGVIAGNVTLGKTYHLAAGVVGYAVEPLIYDFTFAGGYASLTFVAEGAPDPKPTPTPLPKPCLPKGVRRGKGGCK